MEVVRAKKELIIVLIIELVIELIDRANNGANRRALVDKLEPCLRRSSAFDGIRGNRLIKSFC